LLEGDVPMKDWHHGTTVIYKYLDTRQEFLRPILTIRQLLVGDVLKYCLPAL
jgi:hypothetical protein